MKFNKVGRLFISAVLVSMLIACGETDQKELNANHLARAKAYAEQGQYKAATIEYKNAVKKSGGEASSIVQYAEMLIKLGQYDAALSLLEQVSTDKDESYYVALVESYQGKHKYLSAELVLDEHLSGNSVELQMLRAHNLLGLNELEQAVNAYQKILNDEAGNDLATLGKATALVRSNQVKESKGLLNSIPKGAKAFSKARILLAGIAIGEQNLEQAEDILTDLLSTMDNTDIIEPEKAVVLERLSYVLTRQGRSNEAYIYTKLLSEAFPGSNEVKEKYQLAVEKMQAGELDASKATLIEILNDYPSYKLATQLLGI
ncbi:tetratricopeptide repeat protein, partial [Oleiphilus sp. HI0061]